MPSRAILVAGLLAVAVVAGCAVTADRIGPGPPSVVVASAVAAAPVRDGIRLDENVGKPVGPKGLPIGTYRIVDDSAHDMNPPGASTQLTPEQRLNLSRQMGYGDDGTWCGWWVGKDAEGADTAAGNAVANDDEVFTLTRSMVGLTLWGDCMVAPSG